MLLLFVSTFSEDKYLYNNLFSLHYIPNPIILIQV